MRSVFESPKALDMFDIYKSCQSKRYQLNTEKIQVPNEFYW